MLQHCSKLQVAIPLLRQKQLLLHPCRIASGRQVLIQRRSNRSCPNTPAISASMQAHMLAALPAILAAAALYVVYKIVRFARSSVDMRLAAKGAAPSSAFAGKVVWITGASQGLGAELARAFAASGAKLILSSRRRHQLQAVADVCRSRFGTQCEVVPFDLCADYSELEQAAAAAHAAFDGAGVDVLVHNAGCSQHSVAEETSAEVAEKMLQLNTLAPIALTRAALPALLRRRSGRIVVVSSMAGRVPSPGQALYSAAKFGLNGYFAALRTEICDRDVGVTICCPGPIATGDEANPRSVYGATGMIKKAVDTSAGGSKRLAPSFVAEQIIAATYHQLDEAWIARQPILLLSYIMQYAPGVGTQILKKIGPKRAAALKAGGSGYDVGGLFRK